jgi:hypothetical protein
MIASSSWATSTDQVPEQRHEPLGYSAVVFFSTHPLPSTGRTQPDATQWAEPVEDFHSGGLAEVDSDASAFVKAFHLSPPFRTRVSHALILLASSGDHPHGLPR